MFIVLGLIAIIGTVIYYVEKKVIQKEVPSHQDLVKTFLYTAAMGYFITFFLDDQDTVSSVAKTANVREILTGNPPF